MVIVKTRLLLLIAGLISEALLHLSIHFFFKSVRSVLTPGRTENKAFWSNFLSLVAIPDNTGKRNMIPGTEDSDKSLKQDMWAKQHL